jgi:hypothetical protein
LVDLSKITICALMNPNLIISPLVFVGLFIILAFEVRWVSVFSVVILFIGLFIQSKVGALFKATNFARMGQSDKRGKVIGEVMAGIKIIKFKGWESLMNDLIMKIREVEG